MNVAGFQLYLVHYIHLSQGYHINVSVQPHEVLKLLHCALAVHSRSPCDPQSGRLMGNGCLPSRAWLVVIDHH